MAEQTGASKESSAAGGASKRGKKQIPTLYYVLGAGALLVAYYAYAKSQANKQATTAAATSAPAGGTAAGSYGNAGDLAALAPYLNSTAANGQSTQGSGAGAIPGNQVLVGQGYQPAGGQAGQTVTGANGMTYSWVPGQALPSLVGTTLYTQTTPGIFTAINPNSPPTPATAIYQLVPQQGNG